MDRSEKSEFDELNIRNFQGRISRDSLAENLWQLVNIPSPTGMERKAALFFAELLKSSGATVEVDESIPQSPNIIGRLKGRRKGRVIQLAGHIDHVDIPHAKPKRETGIIKTPSPLQPKED